jgi:TIR domain
MEEAGAGLIQVFMDERDIEVGELIQDAVLRGIEQSDEVLVLLSSASKDRPWVIYEIGAAQMARKPIGATVDKVALNDVPALLALSKNVDLNDFDVYVSQLVKRAKQGD